MIHPFNRTKQLRLRRHIRHSRRKVEGLGVQAEQQLERHVFTRLSKFAPVRRFVIGWVAVVVLLAAGVMYQLTTLSRYYQRVQAIPGGMYTEGILGAYTDANPLYSTGSVDSAVSRLLFSSLLTYDASGNLVNDLATNWSVDDKGTTYTVNLRPNLVWHDDAPLTAADVVFTYSTIQSPDAKSPLLSSWQGVVIKATGPLTVTFQLPNALTSFPHSLTTGLVPKHLLASVPISQLRSAPFNTNKPVGSGPFKLESLQATGDTPDTRQEQISLVPNPQYHRGVPKLDHFIIRTFMNKDALLKSFNKHELTAVSGLDSLPTSLDGDTRIRDYRITLSSEVGAFFKISNPIFSDQKVRQALVQGTDQVSAARSLGYPTVLAKSPFLKAQFPYNPNLSQLPYDPTQAAKLLDEAGWKFAPGAQYRTKDGKQLTFQLYTQDTPDYATVAKVLQHQWQQLGVNASVMLQTESDLQKVMSTHSYDALLYGISIGPDPDVFAYWHSSQANILSANRLNFSEYKSGATDKALEAGRIRADPAIRTIKYKAFLEAWRGDAPAVMLYQPSYLYVTSVSVYGFDSDLMHQPTDRYANVQNWMIRTAKVSNK